MRGGLLWVFVKDVCSEPCCSGVCFAVHVVCLLPFCLDVSRLLLLCCCVVLRCCACCCFQSAVVWCAVALWVFVGCLEVLSHEVVSTSVDEGMVSCMCVVRSGVIVVLAAGCACWLLLCAVGWCMLVVMRGVTMYLLRRCGGVYSGEQGN